MGKDSHSQVRFKPEMPRIPGVTDVPAKPEPHGAPPRWRPTAVVAVPLAAALVMGVAIAWWVMRGPRQAATSQPALPPAPQVSSPAPEPANPHAANPVAELPVVPAVGPVEVASLKDLAKPWSSKKFLFRKRLTDQTLPAIVVRLPGGPANRSSSYWAFSLQAPFAQCHLEFVTDLSKLASEYGFRARHPMVGDPCNRTVYDPLRIGSLPGGAWARGDIAQGAGIRPPIAVDIRVQGDHLVASQIE